jgi:hypothetical protein
MSFADEWVFEPDGDLMVASPFSVGPWSPTMQHGGAPASLVVRMAERVPTASPMRIARLTIDLMRPVPVAPLEVATEVVREGRKIQLVQVSLRAGGQECVRASVLKIRADNQADEAIAPPFDLPGFEGEGRVDNPFGAVNAFASALTVRPVRGSMGEPGPASLWFRMNRPIVKGEALSPAMRAALTADFSNGVSRAVDFTDWTFLNADLTVSFAREPEGEWILLDAETWLGGEGAGLAMGRLADRRGWFGRCVQSILLERR